MKFIDKMSSEEINSSPGFLAACIKAIRQRLNLLDF